jgi:putative protease
MNVLAPFSKFESLQNIIDSGADEIYSGFHDERWFEKFGEYIQLNHMSESKRANDNSFEKIFDVIKFVKKNGRKIFLTFNSNEYSDEGLLEIEKYFEELEGASVDGVIISNVSQVRLAQKYHLKPIASTVCAIYNRNIAKVYIDEGVDRLIIPRDVMIKDIALLTQAYPKVEFEIFLMRTGCIFSNNYCLGTHRSPFSGLCGHIREADCQVITPNNNFGPRHDAVLNNTFYREHLFGTNNDYACGQCAIYRLNMLGIASVKIVGRAADWKRTCSDIKMTKNNIKIAQACRSEEEFLEKMEFPPKRDELCSLGLCCYYPEVRFGT